MDNLAFALIVSLNFFGWPMTQVIICSITGAVCELLCEIVFSPVGYKVTKQWKEEDVGIDYLKYLERQGETK